MSVIQILNMIEKTQFRIRYYSLRTLFGGGIFLVFFFVLLHDYHKFFSLQNMTKSSLALLVSVWIIYTFAPDLLKAWTSFVSTNHDLVTIHPDKIEIPELYVKTWSLQQQLVSIPLEMILRVSYKEKIYLLNIEYKTDKKETMLTLYPDQFAGDKNGLKKMYSSLQEKCPDKIV